MTSGGGRRKDPAGDNPNIGVPHPGKSPAGIHCAACGTDVLRGDFAECVYWTDPNGQWVVAHAICLTPYDAALLAVLGPNR